LLVVIAIIAILAAILFPVFARARENSRRASCQSNLKQIGLGILQYTQDYDEKYLPAMGAPPSATQNNTAWVTTLQPYLKSTQIFMCPSGVQTVAPASPNGTDGMWQVEAPAWTVTARSHYGINGNFVVTPPLSMSSVQTPAITALAFDCTQRQESFIGVPTPPTSNSIWDAARHFDGTNFLYADGHVKAYNTRRAPYPDERVLVFGNIGS
jgi:prepilin-type processing-associated H-X9-DG protein